jgi:putative SOS response-associated peptidase YedK
MCGRYASARSVDVLAGHFDAELVDELDLPARYNVAPTDPVLVVVSRDGGRALGVMRWGLVPPWAPDPSGAAKMINARVETVGERPAYRAALAQRRCLIPADGYYEWYAARPGAPKQPHFIRAADGGPLAFAGLWERWYGGPDRRDQALLTCTVLTTASAGRVAHLHDRMPLVLPPAAWGDWLDTARVDATGALEIAAGADVPDLVAHPVGTRVNDVRADGPELVTEITPPPVPEQLDLLS